MGETEFSSPPGHDANKEGSGPAGDAKGNVTRINEGSFIVDRKNFDQHNKSEGDDEKKNSNSERANADEEGGLEIIFVKNVGQALAHSFGQDNPILRSIEKMNVFHHRT